MDSNELRNAARDAAKRYFGDDEIDEICVPEHDGYLAGFRAGVKYARDGQLGRCRPTRPTRPTRRANKSRVLPSGAKLRG